MRLLVALVAVSLSVSCTHAPVRDESTGATDEATFSNARAESESISSEQLEHSLPAVVLIISNRPNGEVGYGSGLLLPENGRVLTSLHVVKEGSLAAMLYREGRVSYTPMDGGLSRYLFENARDLVPARLVQSDPGSDLAIIEITADTRSYPKLPFAKNAVRVGDKVFALGHPQETVWSFTTGVVNGIHHGAIQHDAVISHGSSGGPLLNSRGEVIGINGAKVVNDPRGMAFARPVNLIRDFLDAASTTPEIDFASLDNAVTGCWRAQELGSPALVDCFDIDARWNVFITAHTEFKERLRLTGKAAEKFDQATLPPGGKAGFADRFRKNMIRWLRGEKMSQSAAPPLEIAQDERVREVLTEAVNEYEAMGKNRARYLEQQNGLKLPTDDLESLRRTLRMGIRLDEVAKVNTDFAWVRLAGRNTDGSEFVFSELWHVQNGRWSQRSPPSPDELKTLAKDFPRPIESYEYTVKKFAAQLAMDLLPPRPELPVRDDGTHNDSQMGGSLPACAFKTRCGSGRACL